MDQPPSDPVRTRRSRRRRRRSWRQSPTVQFLRDWWVELSIVLLAALGLFLLLERMHIRQALLRWLARGVETLLHLQANVRAKIEQFVQNASIADLVGAAVLLLALIFVLRRLRWRLLTMPRFTTRICPRCGGQVHRVHRRSIDRMINAFVPVRRYRCKSPTCRWKGLRTGRGWED